MGLHGSSKIVAWIYQSLSSITKVSPSQFSAIETCWATALERNGLFVVNDGEKLALLILQSEPQSGTVHVSHGRYVCNENGQISTLALQGKEQKEKWQSPFYFSQLTEPNPAIHANSLQRHGYVLETLYPASIYRLKMEGKLREREADLFGQQCGLLFGSDWLDWNLHYFRPSIIELSFLPGTPAFHSKVKHLLKINALRLVITFVKSQNISGQVDSSFCRILAELVFQELLRTSSIALITFLNRLNAAALDIITQTSDQTIYAYHYLMEDDSANTYWRRLQAFKAYPVLAEVFRLEETFKKGIDFEEGLNPLIARRFQCSKRSLKYLSCYKGIDLSWWAGKSIHYPQLFQAFEGIADQHLPQSQREWHNFHNSFILIHSSPVKDLLGIQFGKLGPNWADSHRQLIENNNDEKLSTFFKQFVSDVFLANHQGLIARLKGETIDYKGLASSVFKSTSLSQLIKYSVHFSTRQAARSTMFLGFDRGPAEEKIDKIDLPIWFDEKTRIDFVPLTKECDFKKEGDVQGNCVASYYKRYVTGGTHIVSLRKRTQSKTRHIATLRVSFRTPEPQIVELEMSFRKNASQEVRNCALRYLTFCQKALSEDDLSFLSRRYNRALIRCGHGYDAGRVENRVAVFEFYKPHLPKRYRKLSLNDFLQKVVDDFQRTEIMPFIKIMDQDKQGD